MAKTDTVDPTATGEGGGKKQAGRPAKKKAFKKRGLEIHTGTQIETIDASGEGVRLKGSKGGKPIELTAEKVLVAVGRRALSEEVGLEKTRVKIDRGFIEVDAMMRTAEPGIYAIGDLLKTQALAHLASREGMEAVEHMAGKNPHPIDYDKIPSCTYCAPEVASVCLSGGGARKRGHGVVVGAFPFSAIAQARVLDDPRGFVEIVAGKKPGQFHQQIKFGAAGAQVVAETAMAQRQVTADLAVILLAQGPFRRRHALDLAGDMEGALKLPVVQA